MTDAMDMIFVFGSNEAGIHGAGAAREAVEQFGAIPGRGYGLQGSSFAIPTKDKNINTLPLYAIRNYVARFIDYAMRQPGMEFQVTQIGCGLAGLKAEEIAPMFVGAPDNCLFDSAWEPFLPGRRFWGTFGGNNEGL
jgi:hypothetical protein